MYKNLATAAMSTRAVASFIPPVFSFLPLQRKRSAA